MTGPDQIQMTGPDTSDQMTGTGPEHQTSEQDAAADTATATDTATGSRTVTRPDSQMTDL